MPTIAELSMQDYDIFHCNIETKTGRGVLLLTHTSLKATQVKSTSNFEELSSQRFHSRKRKKALIGCMYRSPNSEPENNEKLCEELRTLRNRYDTMLIMGDFNFRNINWEQNSTRGGDTTSCDHRFLEAIKDCSMYQHVTQPARGRGEDAPSLLDLILTNEQEVVSALKYISPLGKSDHAFYRSPVASEEWQNLQTASY